jgi:hypothetical protein
MTRPLFEIAPDLKACEDMQARLADDPEAGELQRVMLDEWFSQVKEEEGQKLDSYVHLIRRAEEREAIHRAEAEQVKMELERREQSADSEAAFAERLKKRLKDYLEFTGRAEITTASLRRIAIQKNGGKQALHIDLAEVPPTMPDLYVKVERKFNTEEIRRALESGEEVSFARLLPRGTRIVIK